MEEITKLEYLGMVLLRCGQWQQAREEITRVLRDGFIKMWTMAAGKEENIRGRGYEL